MCVHKVLYVHVVLLVLTNNYNAINITLLEKITQTIFYRYVFLNARGSMTQCTVMYVNIHGPIILEERFWFKLN